MASYPNYPAINQNWWQRPDGAPPTQPNGGYNPNLVTSSQNPMDSMVDWLGQTFQRQGGAGNWKKYSGAVQGQLALDPFRFQPQAMQQYQQFMGDPNLGGGYKRGADQSFDWYKQQVHRLNNSPVMKEMFANAQGRNSVVDQQANAQRQAAMRDIAMQSSMQQGAQYNPALARTALMQQSMMGQNMAPQIAAMRSQERQQAQLNYMNAMNQNIGNYGNLAGAAQQQYTDANNRFGALSDIGLQGHAQATSAFNQNPNLAGKTR